jgi:hypothetical protein
MAGSDAIKAMRIVLTALALLNFGPAVADASPEGLRDEIRAADTELFQLMFETRDPAAMAKLIAPDFEMYHDRGGFVAKSGADFLAFYAKDCASWAKPGAVRAKRVLVPETMGVYPVPGYGAIEDGYHDFYGHIGAGSEWKVGRGRFTQLWRKTPDGWQVARAFSYDHVDAKPPTMPVQ